MSPSPIDVPRAPDNRYTLLTPYVSSDVQEAFLYPWMDDNSQPARRFRELVHQIQRPDDNDDSSMIYIQNSPIFVPFLYMIANQAIIEQQGLDGQRELFNLDTGLRHTINARVAPENMNRHSVNWRTQSWRNRPRNVPLPFLSTITQAQWNELEQLAIRYVQWANVSGTTINSRRLGTRRSTQSNPIFGAALSAHRGPRPILTFLITYLTYQSDMFMEREEFSVHNGGRKRKRKTKRKRKRRKYKTLRKKKTNRKLKKTIRLR